MSIIGITGSIASGKTTVAHLMAGKKYPLFTPPTQRRAPPNVFRYENSFISGETSGERPFTSKGRGQTRFLNFGNVLT